MSARCVYEPAGNASRAAEADVELVEARPAERHVEIVHRVVSLRTTRPLPEDYRFHALPDACTYVVLDVEDPRICGVTRLRASSHELNLGRRFHFVNLRLLPGVWSGTVGHGLVDTPYDGDLPLPEFAARLAGRDLDGRRQVLTELVDLLLEQRLVAPNRTTRRILERVEEVHSVEEMAAAAHLSTRQLHRVLTGSLGLAPHDFLKILRLQRTLRTADRSSYADQSHFIRTFRAATGYTPGEFARRYDV